MYVFIQPGQTFREAYHSRLDFVQSLKGYTSLFGVPKQLSCFVGDLPIYERLYLFQILSSKQINSILSLLSGGEAAKEGSSAAVQKY